MHNKLRSKVRLYGGGWEELGAIRYEIEWTIVKPSAMQNTEIDPDTDTITLAEFRPNKDEAMQRAQEIYNDAVAEPNNLCWGTVSIRKQVVAWPNHDEEKILAEWQDAGEADEILSENDYSLYLAKLTVVATK
jgi:hypothetical protein